MSHDNLKKKVEAGVALLDEWDEEWALDIDVERLDISRSSLCVLGQLFGYYFDGLDELGATGSNEHELHGESYGVTGSDGWGWTDECNALTQLWREVVEQRQWNAAVKASA